MRLPPRTVRWVIAAAAATRQVALEVVGGAEVEAGRQVDGEPGLQLAVGDGLADVRHRGAGGDRPVHPAHVVAGPVLPRLPRLGARPGQQAEVVALQQAVELAGDEQLQLAQDEFGPRVVEFGRQVRVQAARTAGLTAVPEPLHAGVAAAAGDQDAGGRDTRFAASVVP